MCLQNKYQIRQEDIPRAFPPRHLPPKYRANSALRPPVVYSRRGTFRAPAQGCGIGNHILSENYISAKNSRECGCSKIRHKTFAGPLPANDGTHTKQNTDYCFSGTCNVQYVPVLRLHGTKHGALGNRQNMLLFVLRTHNNLS